MFWLFVVQTSKNKYNITRVLNKLTHLWCYTNGSYMRLKKSAKNILYSHLFLNSNYVLSQNNQICKL